MPLHTTTIRDMDRFELASILAALRLLQSAPALPAEIEEIATDQGDFERLDNEAIDALCERVNAATGFPWRDMPEKDAETVALETRVAGLFESASVAEGEWAGEASEMRTRDRAQFSEGGR